MLKENIAAVFQAYLNDKATYYRQDSTSRKLSGYRSFHLIQRDMPDSMMDAAGINGWEDDYELSGSIGKGNFTNIPWVCLFDSEITTSPNKGYFIAYLFEANMQRVYLTLMQGWGQYEKLYKDKLGKIRIRENSLKAQSLLASWGTFSLERIQLNGGAKLGVKYELGTICSKMYTWNNLPSNEELKKDLLDLMSLYQELKEELGLDILQANEIAKGDPTTERRFGTTRTLADYLRKYLHLPTRTTFIPEFTGSYEIETSRNKQLIIKRHGLIVSALAAIYKSRGYETPNWPQDLSIINEEANKVEIFEVKTSIGSQSFKTAIGQLIMYASPFSLRGYDVSLKLVCRLEEEVAEIEEYLAKFNIKIIRFHWRDNLPVFDNLEFDA